MPRTITTARTASPVRMVIPRSNPLELVGFDETATGNVTGRNGTVFTDTGTMVVAVGKHGFGRSNTGGARHYSLLDSDPSCDKFSFASGSMCVCCWYMPNTASSGEQALAAKWPVAAGQREWMLFKRGSATFELAFDMSRDGTTVVQASSGVNPSALAKYFVCGWFDAAAGTANIQVNDQTPVSVAAFATAMYSGTENLYLGAYNGGANGRLNGMIDSIYWFDFAPSAGERAWLYNGGSGRDEF